MKNNPTIKQAREDILNLMMDRKALLELVSDMLMSIPDREFFEIFYTKRLLKAQIENSILSEIYNLPNLNSIEKQGLN